MYRDSPMYRHSSVWFHRLKGIKVKHVAQICLFLAIFIWLINEIKHSHDKKTQYNEGDEKVLPQRIRDKLVKLGRKDIITREVETFFKNEENDEQEEEYKAKDDEEYKGERKEDEGTGGGDDVTDEHEHEKSDADIDREEQLINEAEREKDAQKETQETDSEHAHGQMEKEISSEDTDHDEGDGSMNEAREEHYKADDASSAVAHDIESEASGNENEDVENSNENTENKLEEGDSENTDETDDGEGRKSLEVVGAQMAVDNQQLNAASSESKLDIVNNTEIGSFSTNIVAEESNKHLSSNSSTEGTMDTNDLPLQNVTESEPKLDHGQGSLTEDTSAEESNLQAIALEGNYTSVVNLDSSHFDSSPTGSKESKDAESHLEELPNSSNNNTETSMSEYIIRSEASGEAGNNTDSAPKKNDEIKTGDAEMKPWIQQ